MYENQIKTLTNLDINHEKCGGRLKHYNIRAVEFELEQKRRLDKLQEHHRSELQYLLCLKRFKEENMSDPLAPDSHERLAFFEDIVKWFKRKFQRKNRGTPDDQGQFPGGHPDLHRDYDPFRSSRYNRDRYLYEREREDHHKIHKENEDDKQSEPPPDQNDKSSEPPPSGGDGGGNDGGGGGSGGTDDSGSGGGG